jgi:hypothetical protein
VSGRGDRGSGSLGNRGDRGRRSPQAELVIVGIDKDGNKIVPVRIDPPPRSASPVPRADPRVEELARGRKIAGIRQAKIHGALGVSVWWWMGTAQGDRRRTRR